MKAILDPLLFWFPPGNSGSQADVEAVLKAMDFLVSLTQCGIHISTTEAVWKRINLEFIRSLQSRISPTKLQPRMSILKRHISIDEAPLGVSETWGMKSLFTFTPLPDPDEWMNELAKLAAYWLEQQQEVVFITRLFEGRNIRRHSAGNCTIWEKTCWKVYVKSPGYNGIIGIPCITSLRNLNVHWTIRYDDMLPDSSPTPGLIFEPPLSWDNAQTQAVRTIRAKPCWVDSRGNGWSDTSTPGCAHHWDVFLNDQGLIAEFSDDHVNITRWGTGDRGRVPGSVHH